MYRNNAFRLQDKAAEQMLVVAAAVGVASCFGAPISGERLPFSILNVEFFIGYIYPSVV